MTPVVELKNVHKSFRLGRREVHALRGVDLRIDQPGFLSVMGPSGSGKSTLLHLTAALDTPDEGTVSINGDALNELNERHLTNFRRRKIGIVFQQFNLIPTLTALENVALPAMLDGMSRAQRTERAEEMLDMLHLSDRATHRPDALSGGEQQRVAIARSLIFRPPILFADEPTGNLDSAASEALWHLLRDLARERTMTILMVTHEPAAAACSEHVYLLRDGRIEDSFDVGTLDAVQLATRAQQPRR